MRFVVDAQLPAALARWLSAQGHEAEHVSDIGMSAASDRVIWEYALQHSAIIVTKDEDFAQRKVLVLNGPSVLWLRVRNTRKQELLLRFAELIPNALAAFERGETLVEVI
jgi:predicted nuclease of predicted toxin-antitoxin system